MNKGKLLLKSAKFSLFLIYKSSGLWIAICFLLAFVASTLGIASTYALKYLLDTLTAESILIPKVILWISIYIVIMLITQANQSIQNILYDTIFKKAEHLYECNLAEKLS